MKSLTSVVSEGFFFLTIKKKNLEDFVLASTTMELPSRHVFAAVEPLCGTISSIPSV